MLLYNLREFRNLATPEAMDAAQLARNLAEGKGYTHAFHRPFASSWCNETDPNGELDQRRPDARDQDGAASGPGQCAGLSRSCWRD